MTTKIDLTTPAKRARLGAPKNPVFMSVAGPRGGVSLGWRHPGRWIAKLVIDGRRVEEKIGISDETYAGMDYKAAVVAALAWAELKRSEDPTTGPLTVGSAVEAYHKDRGTAGVAKYVLSDRTFCAIPLGKLTALDIEAWRVGLSKLKATSQNRHLNNLRAALYAAAERHRAALPASLPTEIKIGTRKLFVAGDDEVRDVSLLTDEQVRRLVEEAYAISEDFGHLVLLAAVTGMRFSQLIRIKVRDLMLDTVIVPGSRKGRRGTAKSPTRIGLMHNVYLRLRKATLDEHGKPRDGGEPLLLRWCYTQNNQGRVGTNWVKSHRGAWKVSKEIEADWREACNNANLLRSVTMYWLRHSSIVRRLLAGQPIRMVAANHDTSALMIEKTYGRWILEADHELARRGALSLVA